MNYKFKLSSTMLSFLGVSFMYYNITLGFWFLLAVLFFDQKDVVKANLLQYFVVKVGITIASAVLGWAGDIFSKIVDLFTDNYETISKIEKFNVFNIAQNWMGYVGIVVFIAFIYLIVKKQLVKVPTIYNFVVKNFTEE